MTRKCCQAGVQRRQDGERLVQGATEGDDPTFDLTNDIIDGHGWFVAGEGKAYVLFEHAFSDMPTMFLFYTADGDSMEVMDGLCTTVTTSKNLSR